MQELMQTPYCNLHSQKQNDNQSPVCWLPNVIVSLRTFKSVVHKLLNDHGGQMPLLSFMDCYRCCILNENLNYRISNSNGSGSSRQNCDVSHQLIVNNENGVSLEHLITCAQDVQIQYNQSYFKQLQWENDKSKPINLQSRGQSLETSESSKPNRFDVIGCELKESPQKPTQEPTQESTEESHRMLNQFTHEVVELFKGVPRCVIPFSKFNNEYHKKYGKQFKVAEFGYTKSVELFESIPLILQILDSEHEKKLTLTHRVQVRRFSNDIIKVLKYHATKQMFADEYPLAYEKQFGKPFDIRDYGVCFLEDMLAELPESIIFRKEIEGRTFIQVPKTIQIEEERLCTLRLANDIIDMLKYKPRFSIQFNKFIPNFHHHFGRQCKLSNYGFTKLIELLEAMPEIIQVFTKDGLQFVQLKDNLMTELICLNFVKHLDENGLKVKASLSKLEEWYNSKHVPIFYQDFDCENFEQLFSKLPFKKYFINVVEAENHEWNLEVEALNEKDVKRFAKNLLKKMIDECEEGLVLYLNEAKTKGKTLKFIEVCEFLVSNNVDLSNQLRHFNKRSLQFISKVMNVYLNIDEHEQNVLGISEVFQFAKQIRSLFKFINVVDITLPELEILYKQKYKNGHGIKSEHQVLNTAMQSIQGQKQPFYNGIPFKRQGLIDSYSLFSQGLSLLLTIKKFNDRRLCLNKKFWRNLKSLFTIFLCLLVQGLNQVHF